jgi:hypothetical protein
LPYKIYKELFCSDNAFWFYGVQIPAWFRVYDAGLRLIVVGVQVAVYVNGSIEVTLNMKSASIK